MKNEKGITLIALVITVIIMLILAGVAITTLINDGGLFDKTLKSAEAFENASQKEAKQLEELMNEIDGYIGELSVDKKAPSVAKLQLSNITDTGFTLTATAKDNVGIAKYEFYIKNDDGSFTLEKTIESEDTTVTYDVTGKTPKQNIYVYKLKVYDKAGNSKESDEIIVSDVDTVAPSVATIVASNVTETGFTLTLTGEDDRGIVKYEIYIKDTDGSFKLEDTIEVSANSTTYNVIGKTPYQKIYECKVVVYDGAGNSKESSVIKVGGQRLASVVQVGDYVDYDAGVWTQEDLDKITSSYNNPTLHSTVNDEITGNQTNPTVQGEFGGFELGQSRNTNSTHYEAGYSGTEYSGWRVWDVNSSTGVVTLVSAGHPESYYHAINYGSRSTNILKQRNCTMYENEYAKAGSAHIITGQEAATWYNKQYNTSYSITEGLGNQSTFYRKVFSTEEPISVFEIGSYVWLASLYDSYNVYCIASGVRYVGGVNNCALGIRILVELNPNVLVQQNIGDGTTSNPWKITQ